MNRDERRSAGKGQSKQRLVLAGLTAFFDNGQRVNLDVSKVQVVDRQTLRPVFEEMLQAEPKKLEQPATPNQEFAEDETQKYQVEFDTPEGRMEFVKDGNWSGVRKVI